MSDARHIARLAAFHAKGGRCEDCGWDEPILDAYDLHHLDPSRKELSFARSFGVARLHDAVTAELEKAVLLCARCHRVRHYFMRSEDAISRDAA